MSTVPPLAEREKAVPSKPTLVVLFVICGATLLMWGAGRAACNYHVPGESLSPRSVSLAEKTTLPKGVALELGQAVAGANWEIAEQLVTGEAGSWLAAEKSACEAGCVERVNAREQLKTRATVLRVIGQEHYVRTETWGAEPAPKSHLWVIERGGAPPVFRAKRVLPADAPLPESARPAAADSPSSIDRHSEQTPAPDSAQEKQPASAE